MIRAGLQILPLLYAGVFLAAIVLLWLFYERGRTRRRRADLRGLCQCRLCAEWIRHGKSPGPFTCPSCGALNEPNSLIDI
jgi:hypothetical protein